MHLPLRPNIADIHNLYQKYKPSQLTKLFLDRAKKLNQDLNSFIYFTDELALSKAEELDAELLNNNLSEILKKKPLFGIPFAVKDIILVEGLNFTAASKILAGFRAPYSATVYQRIEQAGAILIGVCNMDEFAMGSSGESSVYGASKNPIDISRVPGGSSSGSAVAVASGQVVFSLGTDTGGSIRQPASFCDVVGLKPTYGLVSRFGVMPMASSFDQVGAFTNCIEDNLLTTCVLAGYDTKDQTSINSEKLVDKLWISYQQAVDKSNQNIKKFKIGLPVEFYQQGLDKFIGARLDWLKKKLEEEGHELVSVSLPLIKHAISVYYLTMTVEAAANLERFDGVRFALQANDQSELFYAQRGGNFGKEPIRRIMLGTFASSSGYYDAYYNQAQKVRELVRLEFEKVFQDVDLLLTPTTPEFAFKFGEKTTDPISMYLSDIYTCGINPSRIPGLTVPLGLIQTENGQRLPTGCQLLSNELGEDMLFELGKQIQEIVNSDQIN